MVAAILAPQRLWPQSAKRPPLQGTSCVVPAEEIQVLAAQLKSGSAFPQIVVTTTQPMDLDVDAFNLQLATKGQGIPPDVRADFTKKNKSACAIKPFQSVPNLHFINEREEHLIFQKGAIKSWSQFHKEYGKDASIVWLSRVGFNREKTLALFHISDGIDRMGAGGSLYVFERENGRWVLKSYIQTWAT